IISQSFRIDAPKGMTVDSRSGLSIEFIASPKTPAVQPAPAILEIRGSAAQHTVRSEASCNAQIAPRSMFPLRKNKPLSSLCKTVLPPPNWFGIQASLQVRPRQRYLAVLYYFQLGTRQGHFQAHTVFVVSDQLVGQTQGKSIHRTARTNSQSLITGAS